MFILHTDVNCFSFITKLHCVEKQIIEEKADDF